MHIYCTQVLVSRTISGLNWGNVGSRDWTRTSNPSVSLRGFLAVRAECRKCPLTSGFTARTVLVSSERPPAVLAQKHGIKHAPRPGASQCCSPAQMRNMPAATQVSRHQTYFDVRTTWLLAPASSLVDRVNHQSARPSAVLQASRTTASGWAGPAGRVCPPSSVVQLSAVDRVGDGRGAGVAFVRVHTVSCQTLGHARRREWTTALHTSRLPTSATYVAR
jgi:hypothetical protein